MKTTSLLLALVGASSGYMVQAPFSPSAVTEIPLNGFGTWNLKGDNTSEVVSAAMQAGYRHIDCATAYGNQKAVGKGLADGAKAAGLSRSDFWVTSKLWNDHHAPAAVPEALNQTLYDLGLDYLDLWLMHWPVAQDPSDGTNTEDFVDTWRAMAATLVTGKVKHIGICNFSPAQLKKLIDSTKGLVKPYNHQFEIHPYLPQEDFVMWHEENGIKVTAYSPLGNMNPTYSGSSSQVSIVEAIGAEADVPLLLKNHVVTSIAEKRGCTPAQVALSWGISRGVAVIPKSQHADRIKENFENTQCELEAEDFETLKSLPVKRFNNPSKGWGVHLFKGLQDSDASQSVKMAAGKAYSFWAEYAGAWFASARERMGVY